jgi:hypothetical protein
MTPEARELRAAVASLEMQLERARERLAQYERLCPHDWAESVYEPIVREAHTIPGDPPGTMGVDWRGPTSVPRREEPRWRRTCKRCGLVQETRHVKDEVKKVPVFHDQGR